MSSLLHKIERRLEPFAIQNLTLYIVIAQTFVVLGTYLGKVDPNKLLLVPTLVMHGEWWRVLTYAAMPPGFSWSVAFGLYLFYIYGNALEHHLGVLRYNLFLFLGYALTTGLAFLSPNYPATNLFLGGAVFLAFAFLNPDFVLNLFFILPVKIKWLAAFTWALYGVQFVTGGATGRWGVLAATGNFLIFFGREMVSRIRTGRRSIQQHAKRARLKEELSAPMHTCSVCGRDSNAHPDLDYRYRTEGEAEVCYCNDHLPPRT